MEIAGPILNVPVDDVPEKFMPVFDRLHQALNDPEIRRQMQEEEELYRYIENMQSIKQEKITNI